MGGLGVGRGLDFTRRSTRSSLVNILGVRWGLNFTWRSGGGPTGRNEFVDERC